MSPSTIHANDSSYNNNGIYNRANVDARIQVLADDPLRRIWRGDKEGKVSLTGCPKFDNLYEEREWTKVYNISQRLCTSCFILSLSFQAHMAAAFRFWGKRGFNQGLAGHITVKDPVLQDHYW
jgi:hypothetical protein